MYVYNVCVCDEKQNAVRQAGGIIVVCLLKVRVLSFTKTLTVSSKTMVKIGVNVIIFVNFIVQLPSLVLEGSSSAFTFILHQKIHASSLQ